ncbi:transposase [Ralstonia insidiosa]|nr:transposase [Ralstonia insidiosa]
MRWIFTNNYSPIWGIWRAFQGRKVHSNCAPCITKYRVTSFIQRQRRGDCDTTIGRL